MRTLVTGITGFLGGHLAEFLLAQGDSVSGCSRSGEWPRQLAHLAHQARLLPCDLTDPQTAHTLFEHESFDAVFHFAGLANPRACQENPGLALRQNVEATGHLYEAIRQCGQRPRVLFVSSSYVYGQPAPGDLPLRTDCPIRAEHPYASTKWAAEQLSRRYVEEANIDIVCVRPFNHTGPRQPTCYVVSDWAHQIVAIERGESPPRIQVGNLDTRRDYTDVRDVVRAYRTLARAPNAKGVYNLGSGVSRSGREILEILRRLSRVPWEFEVDPSRTRAGEALEIVADTAPLRALIGWQSEIGLESTLCDTLDFLRDHPMQGGNQ